MGFNLAFKGLIDMEILNVTFWFITYKPILFYELIQGSVFSNLSIQAKKSDKSVKLVSSTR
jgi:hypothetical protein